MGNKKDKTNKSTVVKSISISKDLYERVSRKTDNFSRFVEQAIAFYLGYLEREEEEERKKKGILEILKSLLRP